MPKGYGEEYFVMAEDKVDAHLSLLNYFKDKTKDTDNYTKELYTNYLKLWKKVNPLDATTFPNGYMLREFEEGVVVESEIV
jgi:hypothetical protein